MDRAAFYDEVRGSLFGGRLSQPQVDGMESILNFWEEPPVQPTGEFLTNWEVRSLNWLAYMLATTYHETAYSMQPIKEYGSNAYFARYNNRSDLGNGPTDGPLFPGRGFVQLTGRRNYTVMTPIVQSFYPDAPSLVSDPNAAMVDEYAAVIMFYGMFNGIFTGKALKNYLGDPEKGQTENYYQARRIINGLDRAREIANYAERFEAALDAAGATA